MRLAPGGSRLASGRARRAPGESRRALAAPLSLVGARARRRPGRWVLPALGIAVACAFAVTVGAEGVIAGDQSARSVLAALSPLDRAVRVTWQGVVTPQSSRQAHQLLGGLGMRATTEVVLLNPVRLSGVVVRPAAIAPLGRWLPGPRASQLPRCRPALCPVLLAGGGPVPPTLTALDARLTVTGAAALSSAVPFGFAPAAQAQQPVVVTGDPTGLEALPGLSGVYRTVSWLSPLPVAGLHSWQLADTEARLSRAQAALQAGALRAGATPASLTAPFDGLDAARAQAAAAPRSLLLTGGGALGALALFIILAGAALRRDQREALDRLRYAGARTGQRALFVLAEAGWLCAAALTAGVGLGIAATALLAHATGEPVGGVLSHSLISSTGAVAVAGGWVVATSLFGLSVLARSARMIDALATAAVAVLGVGLLLDNPGGARGFAVLLAPLCCLAAGVLTYRVVAVLLVAGERLARHGPIGTRLALVGLARAPALPALGIAFVTVSAGLGGFALAYRATLLAGAADQAADRVPLDALITPTQGFETPLQVAPLPRWEALAGGPVLPVRRTQATYVSGSGTVTVPALGVPAKGLPLIHGWRTGDGSAPLPALAGRLRPAGPVRSPGPALPAGTRRLSLTVASPALPVSVTADLRDPQGAVEAVPMGATSGTGGRLQATVPPGQWELEALELDETTGLQVTNGHQNGENPGAATQSQAAMALGPLMFSGGPAGRPPQTIALGAWRAVGAATDLGPARSAGAVAQVAFAASGLPGLLRPAQPSDVRPVPVLADPQAAATAGPGGRLALTVDGLPVSARVVGTLRRFPTLAADAGGFVIADESTLGGALDAQLPGQGRPDELWVSSRHLGTLRAALDHRPVGDIGFSFRADLTRSLRSAPIARGVLGTLVAASLLSAALATLGLLSALLGGARDGRVETDLVAQGVGPRALRAQALQQLTLAGVIGVSLGVALAALLTLLAVAGVRAAGPVADPRPPLVSVVPWPALAAWGLGLVVLFLGSGWAITESLKGTPRSEAGRRRTAAVEIGRGVAR
jgi:hypothetical protein